MKIGARNLCVLAIAMALAACKPQPGDSAAAAAGEDDGGRGPNVWVFVQINVPEEKGEMESYYYYARIARPQYERIRANELKQGFITLRDVHYWDDDDRMHAYRDIADHGELVFRIEDIRTIKLQNRAPVVGQTYEEYEAGETRPSGRSAPEPEVEADPDIEAKPTRATPTAPAI